MLVNSKNNSHLVKTNKNFFILNLTFLFHLTLSISAPSMPCNGMTRLYIEKVPDAFLREFICFLKFSCYLSMACRNLISTNVGVRYPVPLQKLHLLSRAIHHRYSGNTNPHRTAARYYTSMSRLPMRTPKPPPGSGGRGYQQQRNFWVARLAARLLRLRYILLGSAVGGGYTAKKAST